MLRVAQYLRHPTNELGAYLCLSRISPANCFVLLVLLLSLHGAQRLGCFLPKELGTVGFFVSHIMLKPALELGLKLWGLEEDARIRKSPAH